jgi:hypothetical protein
MQYSIDPSIQARWYLLKAPNGIGTGFAVALVLAFASARFGLWWGNWMSRVQR